jgi:uncharacterized protein YbbC (DUF1343 family)
VLFLGRMRTREFKAEQRAGARFYTCVNVFLVWMSASARLGKVFIV